MVTSELLRQSNFQTLKQSPISLKELIPKENGFTARTELLPDSVVYRAHFPHRPVTPGVCVIQTVCSLIARHYGDGYRLCEVKNVKFLSLILPGQIDELLFDIDCIEDQTTPSRLKVKALVSASERVCARMSLLFEVQ